MKMFCSAVAGTIALGAMASTPYVSNVSVSRNGESGEIVVDYLMNNAPGIVTVDFQTNTSAGVWASIGFDSFRHVAGDVNRIVKPSADVCHIYWLPNEGMDGLSVASGDFRAEVRVWETNAPPDYVVIDLTCTNEYRYYVSDKAFPSPVTNRIYKTDKIVLRKIPAAEVVWQMGSDEDLPFRFNPNNERPHYVTLSEDYYIGIYEVTKRQHRRLLESQSAFVGDFHPADPDVAPFEYVSYNAVRGTASDEFINWPNNPDKHAVAASSLLDKYRKRTGLCLDLPTEAQWEYACRAGTITGLNSGKELTMTSGDCPNLDEVGWHNGNKEKIVDYADKWCEISEVGLKRPNAWGLYDMHGNVSEHCLDLCDLESLTSADPVRDPVGINEGQMHAIRGGSTAAGAILCTSGARDELPLSSNMRYTGIRLCAPAIAVR